MARHMSIPWSLLQSILSGFQIQHIRWQHSASFAGASFNTTHLSFSLGAASRILILMPIYRKHMHNLSRLTRLKSISISCPYYHIDGVAEDNMSIIFDLADPQYLPNGLISSWEAFYELLELWKDIWLALKVEQQDGNLADLFKLSFRKLEKTVGKVPKHIQESEWDTNHWTSKAP